MVLLLILVLTIYYGLTLKPGEFVKDLDHYWILGEGVGIDPRYVRPKLTQVIPVDENGYLISPEKVIAQGTNAKYASGAWAPGQLGPTEWAWMSSVDFPFAMQQAASVLTPAVYFWTIC